MSAARIEGATLPSVPQPSRTPTQRATASFRLHDAQEATSLAPTPSLDALRTGAITREQYIDAKVASAMEHLRDLPAAPRAFIAGELRARLAAGELAHLAPRAARL